MNRSIVIRRVVCFIKSIIWLLLNHQTKPTNQNQTKSIGKVYVTVYLIPILCKHLNFYIRGVARMVMDFVQIMHNWCSLRKNQKMTKSWLLWPPVAMATTILFSLTENTGF